MEVRLHQTEDDLRQILHLQKQNHKDLISPKQAEQEGYLTLKHDLDTLATICGSDGHVIT